MTALSHFLKSTSSGPRIVLLPDPRFFVRTIPISEGATAAEAAAQVELALEGLSPFSPTQLYHGYFWVPRSPTALIFAAYRKRFSADETAEWSEADLVLPVFAALANFEHEPATTIVIPSPDALTAIHWAEGAVPVRVLTQSLAPEASEVDRAQARDALLRLVGESRTVIDLSASLEVAPSPDEDFYVFRAGDFSVRLPVTVASTLDVRDKAALASFRRARLRDQNLWRIFAGCAAALALLLVGELALVGGRFWQKTRIAQIQAQQPVVEKVMTAAELADRIDKLASERLLPFEMIQLVNLAEKRGSGPIYFTRVTANGLHTLQIWAQTTNPDDIDTYRTALQESPAIAGVRVDNAVTRNGLTTFTLVINFKPEALKPAT